MRFLEFFYDKNILNESEYEVNNRLNNFILSGNEDESLKIIHDIVLSFLSKSKSYNRDTYDEPNRLAINTMEQVFMKVRNKQLIDNWYPYVINITKRYFYPIKHEYDSEEFDPKYHDDNFMNSLKLMSGLVDRSNLDDFDTDNLSISDLINYVFDNYCFYNKYTNEYNKLKLSVELSVIHNSIINYHSDTNQVIFMVNVYNKLLEEIR